MLGQGRHELLADIVLELGWPRTPDVQLMPARFTVTALHRDQELDAVATTLGEGDARDGEPLVHLSSDFAADARDPIEIQSHIPP